MNKVKVKGNGPILIVDDDRDFLYLAATCYKSSHCKNPLLQINGGQALMAHLHEVSQGMKALPELILLDINMPILDGFETLEQIRSQPTFRITPIIMMLTGSKNPNDVSRALALGADAYQEKPVSLNRYIEFFNSLCT